MARPDADEAREQLDEQRAEHRHVHHEAHVGEQTRLLVVFGGEHHRVRQQQQRHARLEHVRAREHIHGAPHAALRNGIRNTKPSAI